MIMRGRTARSSRSSVVRCVRLSLAAPYSALQLNWNGHNLTHTESQPLNRLPKDFAQLMMCTGWITDDDLRWTGPVNVNVLVVVMWRAHCWMIDSSRSKVTPTFGWTRCPNVVDVYNCDSCCSSNITLHDCCCFRCDTLCVLSLTWQWVTSLFG